ncbi:MAG: hypothetical protein HUK40_18730 [Desulfobacter sp.]|nr:hypothetical protein [Desulfobacter sp.]
MINFMKKAGIYDEKTKIKRCSVFYSSHGVMICLFFILSSAGAGEVKLFSNFNKSTVFNLKSTRFTLSKPMVITRIETYHWNNQQGTQTVGRVGIKGVGSWQAKGSPGMYNTPNAYWKVYPNIVLNPGTYIVTDSDPSTWSQNAGSGGIGFARIFGRPVKNSPGSTSTPQPLPPSPPKASPQG